MSAMIATLETMYDNSWYPDSGVTNIANVGNLMSKTEFFRLDQVYMGNGKGLSINYIWSVHVYFSLLFFRNSFFKTFVTCSLDNKKSTYQCLKVCKR